MWSPHNFFSVSRDPAALWTQAVKQDVILHSRGQVLEPELKAESKLQMGP